MRDIINPEWNEEDEKPGSTVDETKKEIAETMGKPKKRLSVGISGQPRLHGGYPTTVEITERLRDILGEWKELYDMTLLCPFLGEGDLLAAECAQGMNLPVEAVLDAPLRQVMRRIHEKTAGQETTELRYRQAFANCKSVRVIARECGAERGYAAPEEPGAYIAARCGALLAIWDGKTLPLTAPDGAPVNRSSTFAIIRLAQERGIWVHVIPCPR